MKVSDHQTTYTRKVELALHDRCLRLVFIQVAVIYHDDLSESDKRVPVLVLLGWSSKDL